MKNLPVLCLAVLLSSAGTAHAQAPPPSDEKTSTPPSWTSEPIAARSYDGDLSKLPKVDLDVMGTLRKASASRYNPRPEKLRREPPPVPAPQRDPLLDRQASAAASKGATSFGTPESNIAGLGFNGCCPPDMVGDVGPTYYIQMINSSVFAIYDKDTGMAVAGPSSLDSLWTLGGACATGRGDPIVLYDQLAERWMMSEFSTTGNNLCVYVSQTDDPVSGGWHLYAFPAPEFPDYPKYGIWPDAYYVTANESSPTVYAMDRVRMLDGLSATFQRFTVPDLNLFGFQTLTPADHDGDTPPPASSPGILMRHCDDAHAQCAEDQLQIYELAIDFDTPGNSVLSGPTNIPVASFDSHLCSYTSFFCFPQPGVGTTLDPLREPIMWRLVYRNFGGYEVLVGTYVTDVNGMDHGGVRWFELRNTGGGWSLFQEGTYAIDSDDRFMSTIAMDGNGNMALGYSVTSSTTFPSIRYTGRLATDTAGTMPAGEHNIQAGSGSQSGFGGNRYGDYAAMSIDPEDDCTFWFTHQYVDGDGDWATRIASMRFPECGAPDIFADGFETGAASEWSNVVQ